MPGRDGTGPTGAGPMTGRGMGACTGTNAPFAWGGYGGWYRWGCGRGYGRGYGRGCGFVPYGYVPGEHAYYNQPPTKEMLQAQKEQLENTLAALNRQIESL